MKKMLFMITFFLSVVLIISGCEIYRIAYTKEIPEGNKTVEHQLENESRILNQTIFEEKISAELRYKIEKINQEIIHIKVYFTHGLNKSEEEKLTLEGIKFLTFRGINSWYVSIPANKIESFSKSELVKSVTEIKPKEKSQLFGDLIGDDPKDLERY
ncbi:hypothetical protein HYS31_06070, partial [Candidatus Woesearchaeota archaeon]|nr:hypothetical protein [Candidatus Woesearchaeota archaeon]